MLVPLGLTMGLLVAMTTKHLVADFFLQTSAIAQGKAAARGWLKPIMIHAGSHAVITLAIALLVAPALWWLAPAELVLHAAIDRLKVIVARDRQLDPSKEGFWWLLGIDQYLHQMTNLALVLILIMAVG
jgi:hypothetical protein